MEAAISTAYITIERCTAQKLQLGDSFHLVSNK